MRHLKQIQCEFCGSIGVQGALTYPKNFAMGLRRICRGCLQKMYNSKPIYLQYPNDACSCAKGYGAVMPCPKCGTKKVPQKNAWRVPARRGTV